MSEQWTTERAAADPAGALAWARMVPMISREQLGEPFSDALSRAMHIEVAALRALVREFAAAVQKSLTEPGHDGLYAVLAKVPTDLKE